MNNFQRSWLKALVQWPASRVAWRAHCALWRRLTREQKQMLLCQDRLILTGNHHGNTYRLPWAGRLQIRLQINPRSPGFMFEDDQDRLVCAVTEDQHLPHRADVILAMKIWIETNELALGNRIATHAQNIYFPEYQRLSPVLQPFFSSTAYSNV